MIQLKFKSKELEQEYVENLQMDLHHTGLDIEIEVKDDDSGSGRSFLDSLRLNEIGWIDEFTEILDDEGIELRDIDLHDKETQDRIETKLKQAIKEQK